MYKPFKKLLVPLLALVTILACSPFAAATPQPAATLNALYTSAAQTLEAMSTQGVAVTVTSASQPSATPSLSIPTATPLVLSTYTSAPPNQPVTRCDAAAFVSDVTYEDGSIIAPGSAFRKIWRLKNIGTCTWNTSYSLVFVGGEKLGAPNAVSVPASVPPGQVVDLAVDMTSPTRGGSYVGYWKLRNPSGALFGVGNGDSSVYVDVSVAGYNVGAYDFIAGHCEADWNNGTKDIRVCPGNEGAERGFVLALNSPKMEDGKSIGNGLLTHPEQTDDGYVTGKYPNFTVQNGDRFQATIGCLEKANDCDVIYRLQYQIGNGSIHTLGQWRELYEGGSYAISVDLSSLRGEKVKFILSVLANGSSHEDYALWINPRITRLSSNPPTATFTPTRPAPTATSTATTPPTATWTATSPVVVQPTDTPTATATPTKVP